MLPAPAKAIRIIDFYVTKAGRERIVFAIAPV
jgi:hypothetical protein